MAVDILELGGSLGYLDEVYEQLQTEPATVDPSWNEALGIAKPASGAIANGTNGQAANGAAAYANGATNGHAAIGAPVSPTFARPGQVTLAPAVAMPSVWPLVNAYRERGHFAAKLDPLGIVQTAHIDELDPATWGLTNASQMMSPTGVHGLPRATLADLVGALRRIYSGSVGLEYMHIASSQRRSWLAERMETQLSVAPTAPVRERALQLLINAEEFERFCHKKFPGTKWFSIEGTEGLLPALDLILTHTARLGAIEAVIGMAHRGRLATLEQVLKRPTREIFNQFEDVEPEKSLGGGDVKYHLGYSTDRLDPNGNAMHVSLAFNPSHLEAVDPVVVGRVRAKQMRHGDLEARRVVGVLVHGDAAFAGQGLVPETLQLSGLPGFRTGGTIHFIVNNQVGFTASPAESRSTPYCTDVAKMLEIPIWHVNGEDVDALARVIEMACEYRAQFQSDVVVDMYGYRKYGHNEIDEPAFTQPLMYDRINQKASPVEVYTQKLVADGIVDAAQVAKMVQHRADELEAELTAAKNIKQRPDNSSLAAMWRGYHAGISETPDFTDTRVARPLLEQIAQSITSTPAGFTPHPKITRLLEQRAQMGKGERQLDWGMAEMLAYGSLLYQQINVRLSGQDCARGTFSHRHAIITDIKTGAEHLMLGGLHPDQGQCRIYDSSLSEAGVLGFEFGYSLDYPDALIMWEAQFGDFANGAQVIIDQFITSSEDKWKRLSGLVLLLPHGYEGQGAEHSSARLERFLQMCAEQNIRVVQPTTPAQMFHLLRTQVLRRRRKPLVVMTPKSLLRLPAAASTLDELADGEFQRVIADATAAPDKVTRVLACSGRVYYDLVEERTKRKADHVAIVRFEQLYPWWADVVARAFAPYPKLREVMWVQDEPLNMGAASFVTPRLEEMLPASAKLEVIARAESASPATGSHKAHVIEEQQILKAAFDPR